jgi:uncharacterized protein YndB with AHSA1/START domain
MVRMFDKIIKHQVYIKAAPEKVYDTLTSASSWNAFFTSGMELEPVPGGKIVWRWKDWGPNFYNVTAEGIIVRAERPINFTFRWFPVGEETPTTVEFALTAEYGGTVLRLVEYGYPDTPEGRAMILECASGWGEALTLLKFYIEHGLAYTPPLKEE